MQRRVHLSLMAMSRNELNHLSQAIYLPAGNERVLCAIKIERKIAFASTIVCVFLLPFI
jgi:hypothetical protein